MKKKLTYLFTRQMFFELLIYPGHYAGCRNLGSDKEIQSLAFDRKKKYKEKTKKQAVWQNQFFLF